MMHNDIIICLLEKTSIHKASGYNYIYYPYYTAEAKRAGKSTYYKRKHISAGAATDEKTFRPDDNYFVLFLNDPSRHEPS